MTKIFIAEIASGRGCFRQWLKPLAPGLVVVLALATGCETDIQDAGQPAAQPSKQAAITPEIPDTIILRESDVLKITFPANANLNTTQPIRRDGMISMPLVGELKAAGKTPKELEKKLMDVYSTQLLSKEVTVEVQSSTFPVYVSGAVLRPGKIVSDHPMTVLEAVMEAGGPDYTKASLTAVTVTRLEEGRYKTYTLNVKRMLEGKQTEPFYLKPSDNVKVPERLWY